jgi:23S rRNA (cytidine1920-2'-O)/16S rRNA (cytidine1409-2'-O)-methyltransferase
MGKEMRADLFLVAQGFASSRTEAQTAIREGKVTANGTPVSSAAQPLRPEMKIRYERPHPYVSRGGLKLSAALDYFGYSPEGKICLDIGASTGGFTQVLLERGAQRVYAVDVGHGQLHRKVASDARVVSLEGVNARDITREKIHELVDALVVDVSFIGLKLVLPPVFALVSKTAWAVLLVKPQFEVGRKGLDKGGIVKDDEMRQAVLDETVTWVGKHGWHIDATMPSPIEGGDGNKEFLIGAMRK